MKPIYVERGDTFFTHSNSLLGRLIRWGETDPDEKGKNGAWSNHTGVIVTSGWLGSETTLAPDQTPAVVVEALWHVRRGPLKLNSTEVRVFCPVPPYTEEEKQRLVVEANNYVGARYGWWKLLFQLADRSIFRGRKVLTRLLFIDKRPICSYLAAKVNDAARRKNGWPGFGMPPQAADPDEMADFCETHPEFWIEVK